MLTVLLLLLAALMIYLSCEYFVNGVEWLGLRLGLGESAVGTVLAAFGTALPESVVTFIAVAGGGGHSQQEIGVGAALGGPLVLATVAYAIVGIVFLLKKRSGPLLAEADQHRLARDQRWFLVIFAFKVALGLVAFAWKPWLGWLFFAAYCLYTWREITASEHPPEEERELEPLKIRPRDLQPTMPWILLQTGLSLAVIYVASRTFVHQLEGIATLLGITPQLTALLLSPVATELPETLNAIIWLRQGKIPLAMANISGAMLIQATIPSGLGIIYTPWMLDRPLTVAATFTFVAIFFMWLTLRNGRLSAPRLAVLSLFYVAFAIMVIMQGVIRF